MFNFVKSLDGEVMQLERKQAAAGTYEVGMALTISDGKLVKATGNAVVHCVCAENTVLTADGLLTVFIVTPSMIFSVEITAFAAAVHTMGARAQISSDGMAITNVAATEESKSGAFIIDALGAKAAGDTCMVRLDYLN